MSMMSPKMADPGIRIALIEAAARLLARHEPLTVRGLAAQVGSSTMAVYTHFGSMDDLRRAVRQEGFARLSEHLAAVRPTRDPVADLASIGWAYCANALANPNLYRVMFLETPLDPEDAGVGAATFLPVVEAVERSMAAGRFRRGDSWSTAVQLWTAEHGMVTIVLAGMLEVGEMIEHLTSMGINLYVGLGDSRKAAIRSIQRAKRRMEAASPPAAPVRTAS
jgi:AcrR family transcriptional regulator